MPTSCIQPDLGRRIVVVPHSVVARVLPLRAKKRPIHKGLPPESLGPQSVSAMGGNALGLVGVTLNAARASEHGAVSCTMR
jgi:hypothetical protein